LYGRHTSQIGVRTPSPACWGRWPEGPDGVWPASSNRVGLHDRQREPTSERTWFPHPIRPFGAPSPLRGEGVYRGARALDLGGSGLPRPCHFRARIQCFQAVAAPGFRGAPPSRHPLRRDPGGLGVAAAVSPSEIDLRPQAHGQSRARKPACLDSTLLIELKCERHSHLHQENVDLAAAPRASAGAHDASIPRSARPQAPIDTAFCPCACFVLGFEARVRERTFAYKTGPRGACAGVSPSKAGPAFARRGVLFENTPLARRQWTGLDDEHLASIGFVNFAWNALERRFASLVWVTAGWTQEVGELVVAGMGNVSLVTLFFNLLKQELKKRDDRRLWEQGAQTGILFDAIRDARNDVVHTFFHCDPTTGAEGYFKGSPRKSTTGKAEVRTVAMEKSDIDELCFAISDCLESIDDLILKLWFRRRFLRNRRAPALSYERAVH